MYCEVNVTFNQVHIYNTFMLVHMCGTFSQLYLLHMYSVLYIDKYVFSCGATNQAFLAIHSEANYMLY